jgi:hypothetical protein
MRIAISGSACQGKSTLVNDIINKWPMYKRSKESYRAYIKKNDIKLNKEVTKESQLEILKLILSDIKNTSKDDNIVFDRCCLDNIVYSLWSNAKSTSDIDDDFIHECIPLIKESMHHLDIIFFLPITNVAPVPIVQKTNREIDPVYITEIDNIFKVISHGLYHTGKSPFFPDEDRPPIIEIFGSPEERIEMVKLYIGDTGRLVEDNSIFSTENMDMMESILKMQKDINKDEQHEREILDKIIAENNKRK